MKKFELSIPKPCHENWDKMTPSEKGRFCGSCQKTVVDFSDMSDRQVAEFFKKPAGSVCGRFANDQLNRIIDVPRKRIPWIKYFFTISLPAFLFSMKAGAQGEVRLTGKVAVCKKPLMGDTTIVKEPQVEVVKEMVKQPVIKLQPNLDSFKSHAESLQRQLKEIEAQRINEVKTIQQLQGILGFVTISEPSKTIVKESPKNVMPVAKQDHFTAFSIFPNPAPSNSLLTIQLNKVDEGLYDIDILESTGGLVQHKELPVKKDTKQVPFTITSLTPGAYFVRLTNKKNGKSYTEIVIIQ